MESVTSQTSHTPTHMRYVYGFLCICSCAILAILLWQDIQAPPTMRAEERPPFVDPFEDITLIAKQAVVYDIPTEQIIFGKHEHDAVALASITKLMSAYTAQQNAPNLLQVTILPEDIALEGDQGLFAYEVWRLDDLLDFSLVTSSNDGLSAIAAAVGGVKAPTASHEHQKNIFVDYMNQTTQNLGLTSMHFRNETGLDEEGAPYTGGSGSAYDVARLITILANNYPALVEQTREHTVDRSSLTGYEHIGQNTNLATSAIPGLLASKTGFTDMAGGNLAIVYDNGLNHPVAIVVLGSTIEGRFDDVETLIGATRLYLEQTPDYNLSETP